MFFNKKKSIKVEFFDADTGEMIGWDVMSWKKIPESFETKTLVKIDGETWEMVEANPGKVSQMRKSGELLVRLRKPDHEEVEEGKESPSAKDGELISPEGNFVTSGNGASAPDPVEIEESLPVAEKAPEVPPALEIDPEPEKKVPPTPVSLISPAEDKEPENAVQPPAEEAPQPIIEAEPEKEAEGKSEDTVSEPFELNPVIVGAEVGAVKEEPEVQAEMVDPSKVLMSIPTICNEVPAMEAGSTKDGKRILEIHWDYWREAEFVLKSQESELDWDLDKIRNIYESHQVTQASPDQKSRISTFDSLHIRNAVVKPLAGMGLGRKDLRMTYFPVSSQYEGLGFKGEPGLVKNGFAFRTSAGLNFYGIETAGKLQFLCLAVDNGRPNENLLKQEIEEIARIMEVYELYLVDWTKVLKLDANPEKLFYYFNLQDHLGVNR